MIEREQEEIRTHFNELFGELPLDDVIDALNLTRLYIIPSNRQGPSLMLEPLLHLNNGVMKPGDYVIRALAKMHTLRDYYNANTQDCDEAIDMFISGRKP